MAWHGSSAESQDSSHEMRVHPSDKQKMPYTFAGFLGFANGDEQKAQRMWKESRAVKDAAEPASKRHRSDGGSDPGNATQDVSEEQGGWQAESNAPNYTVTVLNIPIDYTHDILVELHQAAGLDTSKLESSKFEAPTTEDPGFCQVRLRYTEEGIAWEASQRLHGQEVAGEADVVRKVQAQFQKTRSPSTLNPSVYLSDVPVEYTEPMLRELHEELGLGEDALVGAKFLPSRDPTGQTGACICRYSDQSSAEKAIELLRGRAVVTTSGDRKFLGARMAKPARWMVNQGLADEQAAAYKDEKKAARETAKTKKRDNTENGWETNQHRRQEAPQEQQPALWDQGRQAAQERCRRLAAKNQAQEQAQQVHEARQNDFMESQKQNIRSMMSEEFSRKWKLSPKTKSWLHDLPFKVLKPLISQYTPPQQIDNVIPDEVLALLDEPGLFLTGLPNDADEEFVDALLSMYGVMKKCFFMAAGPSASLAVVVMEDIEDAKIAAGELNDLTPDGMEAPLGARLVDPADEKAKGIEKAEGHHKALVALAKKFEPAQSSTTLACPPQIAAQMLPAVMHESAAPPLPPPQAVDVNGFARHWQLDHSTLLYLSQCPAAVQEAVVRGFVPSSAPKQQGEDAKPNLFVSNLPQDVSEELILESFGLYGKVLKSKVMNRNRGTKSSALVLMQTVDEASNVIEHLDQQILEGLEEPVNIRFADNRAQTAKRIAKEVRAFARSVASEVCPPAYPQRRFSDLPGHAPTPPPAVPLLAHNPAFAAVRDLASGGGTPDKIGQLLSTPQGASLQPLLAAIGAKALLESMGQGGQGGLPHQAAVQMQIPPSPLPVSRPAAPPPAVAGWAQAGALPSASTLPIPGSAVQGPPPIRAVRRVNAQPTTLRPATVAEDIDADNAESGVAADLGYGPPTARAPTKRVPKPPAHPPSAAVRAVQSKPSQARSSTSQVHTARQGSSLDDTDDGEGFDEEPMIDAQPSILAGSAARGQKASKQATSWRAGTKPTLKVMTPTSKGKPPSRPTPKAVAGLKPTPKAAAGLGASAKATAPAPAPWRQDAIKYGKVSMSKLQNPTVVQKRPTSKVPLVNPAKWRRSANEDDGSFEDADDCEEEWQDNEEASEDDDW